MITYRKIGRYRGLSHRERGILAGVSDTLLGWHGVRLDTVSRAFVAGYYRGKEVASESIFFLDKPAIAW